MSVLQGAGFWLWGRCWGGVWRACVGLCSPTSSRLCCSGENLQGWSVQGASTCHCGKGRKCVQEKEKWKLQDEHKMTDFASRFSFNLPLVLLHRNSRCKPGHTDCPLSHPQAFAPLTWSTGSSNRSLCWTTAAKTWCHTTQTCPAPPPWTSPTAPSPSVTTWATWLSQLALTVSLPKWDPNWKISWWTIPCPLWEWLTLCSPPCLLGHQRRVAGGAAWAWRTLTMLVSICWHTFHKLLWFLISRWDNLPFVEFFLIFFSPPPPCASSVCVRVCIYYIYRIFFRIFCEETCIFYFKTTNASKILYSICTESVNWIRQELWTGQIYSKQ